MNIKNIVYHVERTESGRKLYSKADENEVRARFAGVPVYLIDDYGQPSVTDEPSSLDEVYKSVRN